MTDATDTPHPEQPSESAGGAPFFGRKAFGDGAGGAMASLRPLAITGAAAAVLSILVGSVIAVQTSKSQAGHVRDDLVVLQQQVRQQGEMVTALGQQVQQLQQVAQTLQQQVQQAQAPGLHKLVQQQGQTLAGLQQGLAEAQRNLAALQQQAAARKPAEPPPAAPANAAGRNRR